MDLDQSSWEKQALTEKNNIGKVLTQKINQVLKKLQKKH